MSDNIEVKCIPHLNSSKSCPKIPFDSMFNNATKMPSSSTSRKSQKKIRPYTISTTDQSSFLSARFSKQISRVVSPHKKIFSLKHRMNKLINTLDKQNLSPEHYQSHKHLVNKFIANSRNVKLVKKISFNNKFFGTDTPTLSDFRMNLIRDYTGENKYVNIEQKINRSKSYYQRQIEFSLKNKTAKQKELNKIIAELEIRKQNNLFSTITTYKMTPKTNNTNTKEIDHETISANSLQTHYNNKMKRKKIYAMKITEEIKHMTCKPYEKLFDKRGKPLQKGLIFNENNLERKIKLYNIIHSLNKVDDDDYSEKNVEKLKNNMILINSINSKHLKGYRPPYIKDSFKTSTIGKYTGLNGVYFSMS